MHSTDFDRRLKRLKTSTQTSRHYAYGPTHHVPSVVLLHMSMSCLSSILLRVVPKAMI